MWSYPCNKGFLFLIKTFNRIKKSLLFWASPYTYTHTHTHMHPPPSYITIGEVKDASTAERAARLPQLRRLRHQTSHTTRYGHRVTIPFLPSFLPSKEHSAICPVPHILLISSLFCLHMPICLAFSQGSDRCFAGSTLHWCATSREQSSISTRTSGSTTFSGNKTGIQGKFLLWVYWRRGA